MTLTQLPRLTSLAALCAFQALPALADVNIYTTRQPELIEPIMQSFTEQTGIKVNLSFVKKGIVEKLKAEGKRSPADLVMTVDIANLKKIADSGVTQSVDSEVLKKAIPSELRSEDHTWFGLTRRGRVIYASKDRVSEGDITTYEELADPKWKGRICTRSGLHNYNLALTSAMIEHHGEEQTTAWLSSIKDNLARKPEGNDRAQVKAIWAGECDISLGNTYYMGKMLTNDDQIEWANSVKIIFPTFQNNGTHVNVSGIAMTTSAPNRDDALQLMEYLVSPKAQELYAQINYEYPVLKTAQPSELVRSWGAFTADTTDLSVIANQRPKALRIVETVDYDG